MKEKNVAIYCRISTIDKGQTLEQQELPLIEYCKKSNRNYEIFKEFSSGMKESRPKLDLMMQKIRNNEIDLVLVYKLDRLGRSLKHLLQLVEEFKNKKVNFISYTEGFDTTTSQGTFLFQVLGSASEFERALIMERTKNKLNYQKEQIKEKGYFINKQGKKIKSLGRPFGSKDSKVRRKSGYYMRWLKEKQ